MELASYISVDVETAGPVPSLYSMLSIGACSIANPTQTFYVELKPVNDRFLPEALAVHQLSWEDLKQDGLSPEEGLLRFERWLGDVVPNGLAPVFVAFNAPFDWMFVNDYFHRFLGRNPFGHKALDIKAFYMGLRQVPWDNTSFAQISRDYLKTDYLSHHALEDALEQADIFRRMLDSIRSP